MQRLLILVLMLAAVPADATRVNGAADHAAGLSVAVDEGAELTVGCAPPAGDVEGFFAGFTITNAAGPKAGRINSLFMAAYAKNGDAFAFVRAGEAEAGHSIPLGAERVGEGFEVTLGAAYPSMLRIGSAWWGAPPVCMFTLDGEAIALDTLAPSAAQTARASDFGGTLGVDTTVADLSVEQSFTRNATGYLMGMLACANGTATASGPEGQFSEINNAPPLPGVPIVLASETNGAWTYTRSCVDTFAPVLWTMEIV